MDSSSIFLRVFGISYFVRLSVCDHGRRTVEVYAEDVIPHIPGFVVGAPYVICPLSKILKKIGCNWKVISFERIETDKWLYRFVSSNSDWVIEMTVTKDYGKTFKG